MLMSLRKMKPRVLKSAPILGPSWSFLSLSPLIECTTPRPNQVPETRSTRSQWLSSINSCRSKLHTGFPSDHYLLVTEIQVKLAQRKAKPSYSPKLDFSKVNQTLRDEFNRALKDPPQPRGASSDHTAKITFFTDGSGSKGKCTRLTPAGWGWCSKQGNDWLVASGPVSTDPQHLKYLGAQVGSNNTEELSAIIEALLFALEHEYGEVVIHSDSKWAILMIQGIWKPKTNKDLVVLAQRLTHQCGLKVHLQWVKGHVGVEGNELADRLANEGRDTAVFQGGRSIPLPGLTTPPVTDTSSSPLSGFVSRMQVAARTLIPLKERTPGRPWITDTTLHALRQAREAQAAMSENWKQLRNNAKRLARRDRVKWVHDQIHSDPGGDFSQVWNVVRRQRKGFQGKRSHLCVEGKPVPWSSTHKAFRDHLETKQWGPPHIPDHYAARRRARPRIREAEANEGAFTRAELLTALAKTKKGKAPGPDDLVNEILQLLDMDGEERLLRFYNQVWDTGDTPEQWSHATVVSIYKGKGDDTDPGSYRPISLLNVTYKVYASLIQARLAKTFDGKLRHTQSGFRAGRGTRHPLFILRRAMEWSDMTNHNLQLLFLDWKQAFDSLDHTAMLEALTRFGLSYKMVSNVRSIYSAPTFQTKGPEGAIAEGKVGAGIRQGCPLSPYLFIIVLSVIFHDLDEELVRTGVPTNTWSQGYPIYDLEYADDTLLLSLTTPQLQQILNALESIANEYGMRLNKVKTELLVRPGDRPIIRFLDGSIVPTSEVVKYLGSLVTWKKSFEVAFINRASLAEEAYKKLRLVWNSSLGFRSKLQIFQATFVPTLIYGLDSFTLTTPQINRIDAFYIRFLRRVVGIKASFYSRIPNTEVYNRAQRPKLPSEYIGDSQFKMLHEVFNSPREEVHHSVVLCSSYKDRILFQGRRRGMQFPYWVEVMCKQYFPDLHLLGHSASDPHEKYYKMAQMLRDPEVLGKTPKRADSRAWP